MTLNEKRHSPPPRSLFLPNTPKLENTSPCFGQKTLLLHHNVTILDSCIKDIHYLVLVTPSHYFQHYLSQQCIVMPKIAFERHRFSHLPCSHPLINLISWKYLNLVIICLTSNSFTELANVPC